MSLRFLKTAADTGGELLEMEATYEPSRGKPPEHFHPRQSEHFEILEGTMHALIAGEERELRSGDTIDIEAGVPHSMWNEGPDAGENALADEAGAADRGFLRVPLSPRQRGQRRQSGETGRTANRGLRQRIPRRIPHHISASGDPGRRRRRSWRRSAGLLGRKA